MADVVNLSDADTACRRVKWSSEDELNLGSNTLAASADRTSNPIHPPVEAHVVLMIKFSTAGATVNLNRHAGDTPDFVTAGANLKTEVISGTGRVYMAIDTTDALPNFSINIVDDGTGSVIEERDVIFMREFPSKKGYHEARRGFNAFEVDGLSYAMASN